MFRYSAKKLLISDMAGTTIQEKGIVYNSLFNTIKLIKPKLMKGEIAKFSGHNKIDVIRHFVKEENGHKLSKEVIESRGYKKAVKSFQIKYPNIKQVIVSWIKEERELSKVQKLPMGRKKKIGR